jgi:hypothetical protein
VSIANSFAIAGGHQTDQSFRSCQARCNDGL